MSDRNVGLSSPSSTKAGAGAAGMGGGTLLIVLANHLPVQSPLREWLILVSPSVSVMLSVGWWFLLEWIVETMRERQFRSFVSTARRNLREQLTDSSLSDAERNLIVNTLHELLQIESARYIQKIKAMQPVAADSPLRKRRSAQNSRTPSTHA